ncbi:MAG: hypothetical protein ACP5KA_05995 [Desulfurococcaceae archaeon]
MSVLVASLVERAGEGLSSGLALRAREFVAELLVPKTVTGAVVEKYVRKAIRTGAWRVLKQESRALLLALRRWKSALKSPVLLSILREIFVEVELYTLRGRALFYGFVVAVKSHFEKLAEILRDVPRLLTLGIFYLNSPLHYRIYG